MPNVNKCFITGHAGRDAETRTTPNGKTITEINIAVNNGYGENKKTVWTKLKIIGKPAEWMSGACKGDVVSANGAEYCVDEVKKESGIERYHYFLCGMGCDVYYTSKNENEGGRTQAKYDENQEVKEDELPF